MIDIRNMQSAMLKGDTRYSQIKSNFERKFNAPLIELEKAKIVQALTPEIWNSLSEATRNELKKRFNL
jgi:hypothetical protein